MEKTTKHQLLQLLSASNTDAAIKQLLALIPLTEIADIKEEITVLSSRHEQLERDRRTDVISYQQFQTSNNKLTRDITEFVNKIDFSGEKIKHLRTPTITKKDTLKRVVYFSAAILAIIFIWKICSPVGPASSPQQTIYVHGYKSESHVVLENEGKILFTFGNQKNDPEIGEGGRVNIGEIPIKFYKKRIRIAIESKLYEAVEPSKLYIFDGEPIYVEVKIKDEYLIIQGTVKDRFTEENIADAKILVENITSGISDKNGWFKIVVPQEFYKEKYKIQVIKKGYKKASTDYFLDPGMTADLRIEKQQ